MHGAVALVPRVEDSDTQHGTRHKGGRSTKLAAGNARWSWWCRVRYGGAECGVVDLRSVV